MVRVRHVSRAGSEHVGNPKLAYTNIRILGATGELWNIAQLNWRSNESDCVIMAYLLLSVLTALSMV